MRKTNPTAKTACPSSSVAATINSDQQERFRAALKAATNREELLDALRLGFPQRTPLGRRYLRLLAEAIIKDDRPNILVIAGVLLYLSSPAQGSLRTQCMDKNWVAYRNSM